jgi:hypothetical protein
MGRVEEFRQARQFRKKLLLALFLFLVMMIVGLCVSDYSINTLLKNSKRVELVKIENKGSTVYELSFLKRKLLIDTVYMRKDWKRLMEFIKK